MHILHNSSNCLADMFNFFQIQDDNVSIYEYECNPRMNLGYIVFEFSLSLCHINIWSIESNSTWFEQSVSKGCLLHLNFLISRKHDYLYITVIYKIVPMCRISEPFNISIWNTRMWNMISSPATPTVCLEQKSENVQSRNVTLSMPSQSKK